MRDMTQQPRPKRRRGGQAKPASERKRNNLTFRARDQLKADLEKAAATNNRSVSEQIEHYIERAIEWERVLGNLESFKAKVAEDLRQSEAAARHRAGWGKVYDQSNAMRCAIGLILLAALLLMACQYPLRP